MSGSFSTAQCAGVAALLFAGAALCRAQHIVVDGMWVDTSAETETPGLRGGLYGLATPAEILQRSAQTFQWMREARPSASELQAAEAQLRRVDELMQTGDYRRAFVAVRDALALYPALPPLLSRAALVSAILRDYERSEHYFSRYLAVQPDDPQHWAGRAGVLIRLSRLDEARDMIDRGLAAYPELLPLRFHDVTLKVIQETQDISRQYWRRRTFEEVLLLLNWLIADRSEFERMMGAPDYRRLCEITLGPGMSGQLEEAQRLLARAADLRDKKQFAEARAAVEMVLRMGADAYGLRATIADLLISEGRIDEGLGIWDSLTLDFSDWPQPWLSRGQFLLRIGRTTEAVLSLRRAAALAPKEDVVRFALACSLALSGAANEAQQMFNELAGADPQRFRIWMESDPVLEKAVRSVPNAPSYMRAAGIAPESE